MTVEVIVKEDYVFQFFGKDLFYDDVKKFSFEDGDLVIDFNDGSCTSFSFEYVEFFNVIWRCDKEVIV